MAAIRDIKIEKEKKEILNLPLIKELFREAGYPKSFVVTTEDMTPEDEVIELTAGFLREGYTLEESEKKAKEWALFMNSI
jgi:hypothetical protein